jgi:hypothetical protein
MSVVSVARSPRDGKKQGHFVAMGEGLVAWHVGAADEGQGAGKCPVEVGMAGLEGANSIGHGGDVVELQRQARGTGELGETPAQPNLDPHASDLRFGGRS